MSDPVEIPSLVYRWLAMAEVMLRRLSVSICIRAWRRPTSIGRITGSRPDAG